ncbi:6-carboxytetrahydropterin synthase [Thermococcus sp. GR7]|uniref:6-pyruvoyl trahydropterin synthase family protein n=1 Tax=unclassified Thermococcus TaxID=2627626 RepID=UPI0014310F3C|nr:MULTISPECIES: 6-carboxytetrahydropterin synthase [unclassified Thermococcus]NJE47569.1 6-carboxytetrahydropterin synthase [Thermococcus sp. GR7]NJE79339.1 6-carboxytetrahydropterin synthase [Thermococcus sp. GR4]NJF22475.1 6-carboxytetrahydropterin synthase [Thermococcus sp. GR5]
MGFRLTERKIGWHKDFDSSHFLVLPYESKCLRIHGHTYNVDVEIWGDVNESGMIFDFNHLSNLIKLLDHRILVSEEWVVERKNGLIIIEKNGKRLELPENEAVVLDKPNVTAEYIAEWFAERIAEKAGDNVRKIKVKIWEDPRSYAEVTLER